VDRTESPNGDGTQLRHRLRKNNGILTKSLRHHDRECSHLNLAIPSRSEPVKPTRVSEEICCLPAYEIHNPVVTSDLVPH
jgi:hypothetical protein